MFSCFQKIYENKLISNAASLGLSFEEAETRKKIRASRFKSPLVREENAEQASETPEQLLMKSKAYAEKILEQNKRLSC